MDLTDSPDGMPIASQTLVIKPENQANITKSNGSRNIRFHIPDYLGYWLPSQSNFTFNIKMKGRGNPIPSRDAGLHSMFQTIRSHDGTGSHLIEEVLQYNTLVAQQFNYTKTEASENGRAEFEGVQASNSLDNNLYWALAGGTNWSGGTIGQQYIPREVQFVAPLKTKLYDTEQYVPCGALGGIRLELQLENYKRALEYTTGSLGVGSTNALPVYPLSIVTGFEIAATGAQTAKAVFKYSGFTGATTGTGYVAGRIYTYSHNGTVAGFVEVKTAPSGDPTEVEFFAIGAVGATASVAQPTAGDIITLGAAASGPAKKLQLEKGVNPIGFGAVANSYQNLTLPLWTQSGFTLATEAVALSSTGAIASPTTLADDFGAGTLRDPRRNVTPRASAAYDPTGCYPTTVMPFGVGDKMYLSKVDGTGAVVLGICTGVSEYVPTDPGASGMPQLLWRPDRPVQTGLANDVATPAVTAHSRTFSADLGYTHLLGGMKVYVEDADRMNGWTLSTIPSGGSLQYLHDAAGDTVDFTISDIQYQAKQVMMPEKDKAADMAAINSEKGLQIDLETVETRLVNLAAIQGPTSQLISIPNITRALGVLSIPLNQNRQSGLTFRSLVGEPDGMSNYQYELGQNGLVPNRPVVVDKASLGNPLIQTQEVNEKMKVLDSFGYRVANLNRVGMNFSVGRQFSRPNMYFNLMRAGDLILRCAYDSGQSAPKLFCHFINHLRSINISKNGMQIMN